MTYQVKGSPFLLSEHPEAPLFQKSLAQNRKAWIAEIRRALESGETSASEMFASLIRQAGFVSLFFFLAKIAAFSGPYEKLESHSLHLEMANFRQSDACMKKGARAALIVSRGFYKSTIGAHGADTWEAVRNPNIRIRIISAIVERAHSFKNICKSTFESNSFFALFYPEYVPTKSTPRWNETEFVLPNRTRAYTEPTISAGGATGASEGIHVDLLDIDDIEGLEDLDAQHRAAASMMQKKKWFATNSTALLVDLNSRINLKGTFYGGDDIHSMIVADARAIEGYLDPEFSVSESGTWTIYYRSWIEDGIEAFPEVMTSSRYEKLLLEDPWTALTQYSNKPRDPTVSEFYKLETKRFRLRWHEARHEYFLQRGALQDSEEANWEIEMPSSFLRLGSCTVGMYVDPAGTEKGMTARTSRTAILVVAEDSQENAYLLWARVGYFSIQTVFDYIFEGCRLFEGVISKVGVEAAAMQKIIAPLLEKERSLRGEYINPVPIPAKGDKVARIRSNVGRSLMRGLVWLEENAAKEFEEERLLFPNNESRLDTLDAFEKALTDMSKPLSQEEEDLSEVEEEMWANDPTRSLITGM